MNKVLKFFKTQSIKFARKFNLLTMIIAGFSVIFGVSYAYFIVNTSSYRTSEMYMGKLLYGLSVSVVENANAVSGATVTVPANYTYTAFVTITSLNPVKSNYKLLYKTTCTSCSVLIADSTGWNEYGSLKAVSSDFYAKKIKVSIVNPTNASITVTFGASGGYSYNAYSAISLLSGYSEFSNTRYVDKSYKVYFKDVVKDILECTPTTNSPCMYYGEEARNYVSYNNTVYRILGVYLINSVEYVKMIQSSNVSTATTYTNSSTLLSTYYTALPSSKTSFFTGSASLITTTEYTSIGLEDSYVNNNTESLTGTTSGTNIYYMNNKGLLSTKAQSSNSYIKPILTLKTNAYIDYGTTGTSSDPYIFSTSDLIITKITINGVLSNTTPTSGTNSLTSTCSNGTVTWDNNNYILDITMTGTPMICELAFTSS